MRLGFTPLRLIEVTVLELLKIAVSWPLAPFRPGTPCSPLPSVQLLLPLHRVLPGEEVQTAEPEKAGTTLR